MSRTYTIGQSSQRQSQNRFEWSIWIEEDQNTLNDIEAVTYYLHSSFPNPIRVKEDPEKKFLLKTSGWGTFMIRIDILTKDGVETSQSHYLILEDDYNSVTQSQPVSRALKLKEKAKIFLSYSALDQKKALLIKKLLEEQDIEVSTADDTPLGESITDYVDNEVKNSSIVLSIPSEYANTWQEEDNKKALGYKKQILSIAQFLKSSDEEIDKYELDNETLISLINNSTKEIE